MYVNCSLWSAATDLNVTVCFNKHMDPVIYEQDCVGDWICSRSGYLFKYPKVYDSKHDNIWFICVLQAISGIFILLKYMYIPKLINIAFITV